MLGVDVSQAQQKRIRDILVSFLVLWFVTLLQISPTGPGAVYRLHNTCRVQVKLQCSVTLLHA